jgi:hypothetical protein
MKDTIRLLSGAEILFEVTSTSMAVPLQMGKLDYSSGSFIACNVLSLLTCLPLVVNFGKIAPGKAATGENAGLAMMHRTGYGALLGVPRGDQFDAWQMLCAFIFTNLCWVPHSLCQAFSVMGQIYAFHAMIGVYATQLAQHPPPADTPNMQAVFYAIINFYGILPLWRIFMGLLYADYLCLFLGWYIFLACAGMKASYNMYRVMLLPGTAYVHQLVSSRFVYVKDFSVSKSWDAGSEDPDGFDIVTDGPYLDAEAAKAMGLSEKPSSQELQKFLTQYEEEQGGSPVLCVLIFITVLLAAAGATVAVAYAGKHV